MKALIAVLLVLTLSFELHAQLRLPAIFSDDMVLQQQSNVPVWGWAHPMQEVIVKGSWNSVEVKTKTNSHGQWTAKIETPPAGGPFTLSIKSDKEIILKNVMAGEVWLCSGQSNMEWSVWNGAQDAAEEMPSANHPNIRLFHVNRMAADHPQVKGEGRWQPCTPETMKGFSAVGYFFGKRLHQELNVPIGLINASWGGTPAEAWTPDSLIENNTLLAEAAAKLPAQTWGPIQPGAIYNAMIHPLMPFNIAGVIWYQGESNVANSYAYKELMSALINGWREGFNKSFPFYYVQIAPYTYGKPYEGTLIREQQLMMSTIPNTGMVIISDAVDNVRDIHPKFKKPVGDRLANYALADTYKRPDIAHKSPVYKSMEIQKGKIILTFDNAPNGLVSKEGPPTEFMIAGDDKVFHPADAKIKGNTVILSSKNVKKPVAVRFAWNNESIPNLFSKEGLPASTFRTDNWDVQ